MTSPDIALASDFAVAGEAEWRALVAKVLKSADTETFERRLVSRTRDGLRITPLMPAARAAEPVLPVRGGAWGIAARVDHPDPGVAASLALADLEGGADTLVLVPEGARAARGHGMRVPDQTMLDAALAGVGLDMISLRLEPARVSPLTDLLPALAATRGHASGNLAVDFGLDPLDSTMPARVSKLADAGFAGPFVGCDARPVHEAGGSEAQELGYLLAATVAALRAAPGLASSAISYTVAVDADQFLGIAKLRALRRLVARLDEARGITPRPVHIHAETAWRMLTKRDAAVNMLRATIAVFAAGVGGADSIAVLPHTSALGLPDAFARRVARNTGLVLLEESGLAHVADPAAGSGTIEALTDDLARAGWSFFQEIERAGGLAEALRQGLVQQRVAATREARMKDVATRKVAITGVSEFPDLKEMPATVLDVPAGAPAGDGGFPAVRLAEPYERLRDRADAHARSTGAPPRAFICALGPLAEHSTRTLWVTNAIAAAGIAAVLPADTISSSVDAGRIYAESGAPVAIVTGTDETYALLAEATAGALKAAGARVWLAGRPGAGQSALQAQGVDGFIFAGQDLVEALQRMQADTGVVRG